METCLTASSNREMRISKGWFEGKSIVIISGYDYILCLVSVAWNYIIYKMSFFYCRVLFH